MPATTRTFRVFVSSTFEDLKEERNALQRDVFSVLAKLCQEHGARFQAIDLRWGVREEASLDQKTMEICLGEIERCQQTKIKPNFIVLLGDRYGWRPLPAHIKAEEFERMRGTIQDDEALTMVDGWYQRDNNAVPPQYLLKPRTGEFIDADRWSGFEQRLREVLRIAAHNSGLAPADLIKYEGSATHQEIIKGLGDSPEDRQHVFSFFRGGVESGDRDIRELKGYLKRQLRENVFSFDAGDYEELCGQVRESLEKIILDEVKRFESRPASDLEIEAHDAFAKERSKHFVGREPILREIDDYLKGNDRRPFVIHGPSGSGKSAIMGKASNVELGIRRFIGVTPESSNGITLLRSLCMEIARRYGQSEESPATFYELTIAFMDRLKLATPEQPLPLFIDALDQLGAQDPAAVMNWLPTELPPNCKVVVSTIEVPAALQKAQLKKVESFLIEEADEALARWLEESPRKLQSWQRDKLLASFRGCPLPLYLKLSFEEARRWRSFDPIEKCTLGEGLAGIVDQLLSRLSQESSHGPVLVSHALGYLTAARYGLTEDEILAVLSNDDEVWEDFNNRAKHNPPERQLPVIVWSRLYLDLEPYLTERAVPGGTTINFYHRQLAKRVSVSSLHHSALARYFAAQPLWLGPERPNERKVTELVRQQIQGEMLEDAEANLTDVSYLEAKCGAELVFDLQDDYRESVAALSEVQTELLEEKMQQARIARWTQEIILYAQQWNERRDRLKQGHTISDSELELPDVVSSVKPWTNEQLDKECDRIAMSPNRLDRLRAFSLFVEQESHWLLNFGKRAGFLLQRAHNYAPSGPVYVAARKSLDSRHIPFLVRRWSVGATFNPHPALLHTLPIDTTGGLSWLRVDITPNGKKASSAHAATLQLWELETGECLRVIELPDAAVLGLDLTPDGRRVTAGSRTKVLAFDAETGHQVRDMKGHSGQVTCISATPDGRRVLSGSWDGTLRVWDVESGRCLQVLAIRRWFNFSKKNGIDWLFPTDEVCTIAMTPDGRRAVSGSESDSRLKVWDLEAGKCVRVLKGHRRDITCVSVTPDGRRALSGSWDKTIRVWDLGGGKSTRVLKGHGYGISSVSLTPDGRLGVSGCMDHTLRLWDLETGECLRNLEGHTGEVTSVHVTPDGRLVASGSRDGTLRLWDVEKGRCPKIDELRFRTQVTCIKITLDGLRTVTASEDRVGHAVIMPVVWDLDAGQPLRSLKPKGRADRVPVSTLCLTPDGQSCVTVSVNGTLRVWDLGTGSCVRAFDGHPFARCVNVTPDGQRAVSAGVDKTLRVWDLRNGKCVHVFNCENEAVESMDLAPDGRAALTGGQSDDHGEYVMRLWDMATGECRQSFKGHRSIITSVNLTPDGRRAVSASYDRTVRIWELKTGKCMNVLEGHGSLVKSATIMRDGRHVVSLGSDGTLRVWDVENGQCKAMEVTGFPWTAVAVTGSNRLVCWSSLDQHIIFDPLNLEFGPTICTAERMLGAMPSIVARCRACGSVLAVPDKSVAAIWEHVSTLDHDQSPCMELPDSAFQDPRLHASCSSCARPIQFNPFYVNTA